MTLVLRHVWRRVLVLLVMRLLMLMLRLMLLMLDLMLVLVLLVLEVLVLRLLLVLRLRVLLLLLLLMLSRLLEGLHGLIVYLETAVFCQPALVFAGNLPRLVHEVYSPFVGTKGRQQRRRLLGPDVDEVESHTALAGAAALFAIVAFG